MFGFINVQKQFFPSHEQWMKKNLPPIIICYTKVAVALIVYLKGLKVQEKGPFSTAAIPTLMQVNRKQPRGNELVGLDLITIRPAPADKLH